MSELIDIRGSLPSGSSYTGRYEITLSDVEAIVTHHSVSGWVWNPFTQQYTGQAWNDAVDAPPEAEVAHLKAIDVWHTAPNNDWNGFGYHLAAFASGRRYLVGSLNTARAHVASQNWKYVGLVMIGDFTNRAPSDLHLETGRECVADMRAFFGRRLPVKAHTVVQLPEYPTSCPGPLWPEWVPLLDKEDSMARDEDLIALRLEEERRFQAVEAWIMRQRVRLRQSFSESLAEEYAGWIEGAPILQEALSRCSVLGRPG